MAQEDHRAAATLATGVSNQLIAACLSVMSILGAALLFILDKRSLPLSARVCFGASFLLFFASLYFGSKGVARVYKEGHAGNWSYLTGDTSFQKQVLVGFFAIILMAAGIALVGPSSQVNQDPALSRRIDSALVILIDDITRQNALRADVDSLRMELRRLTSKKQHLRGSTATKRVP